LRTNKQPYALYVTVNHEAIKALVPRKEVLGMLGYLWDKDNNLEGRGVRSSGFDLDDANTWALSEYLLGLASARARDQL
jgi:hypothetical protein